MSILKWAAAVAGAGLATLAYGAWTSDRARRDRRTIHLPGWPDRHSGYRIGFLSDLHIRNDGETVRMARAELAWMVAGQPDILILGGDIVSYWGPRTWPLLEEAFAPLAGSPLNGLAVLGNHDYYGGDPTPLGGFLQERGIRLLRNESVVMDDICWLGIDSACDGHARPYDTLFAADIRTPTVCLWHESDFADALPHGLDLVLCGHSHGGQFCTPWGRPFMTADFGGRRLAGLYTDTPSPTYVSRGLATTGPPSRWNCPPESAILTIRPSRAGQPWLSEGG